MARGKKKEELTLEEKLEQALVPVEEQPYEVPENWCWVKLEIVCSCPITDGTHKTPTYCEKVDGVPFVSAKDITSEYIDWSNVKYIVPDLHQELYKRLAPQKNDVLLAKNGTTGVAALVEENAVFDLYVTIAVLRPNVRIVLPQFLYRLINSPICKNQFDNHLTGIGVPNLHLRDIKNISIPLPPIKEQQRIVERIENLFSKLDEAKEKVLDVIQLSEVRQLALINHVFTGELIGIIDLQTIPLFDIVEEIKIGPFGSSLHKEDYIIDGIPVINPKHINKQEINPNKEVSITSEKAKELSAYTLKKNDIIMGRRGEMGRTAPVSQKEEGYICGTGSLIIRLKKGFRADLYSQVLGSQSVINYLEQNCVGSTMKNLNEKIVKQIPVPYFTEEQQGKLMFRFESMLADEKQIFNKLRGIIDAIDMMKKSILAKAFRGELGTNNMKEESAIDLLKAVFNEKYVK